eukprot:6298980-Amphidinium_carterae.1
MHHSFNHQESEKGHQKCQKALLQIFLPQKFKGDRGQSGSGAIEVMRATHGDIQASSGHHPAHRRRTYHHWTQPRRDRTTRIAYMGAFSPK